MRWLWHTWRVMYHSIHDWNWSWNHWTSRQPALGPWRQLGGQGIGCSQLPAVAAAVRGEPEFKFSSGRSCTVVLYSVYSCTVPGPDRVCPGLYSVRGPGLGPGVISLDTASVASTQRVWQSVLLQCYYRVRERVLPRAVYTNLHQNLACVRAPCACTETGSENS